MNRRRNGLGRVLASALLAMAMLLPQTVLATEPAPEGWPNYSNDIPGYRYKDVFETERVKSNGITVDDPEGEAAVGLEFIYFNTTTQEVEYRVKTNEYGGLAPQMLKKNHNYMIFLNSTDYVIKAKTDRKNPNKYVWVQEDGSLRDLKDVTTNDPNLSTEQAHKYSKVRVIELKYWPSDLPKTEANRYNRTKTDIPVHYKGQAVPGVKFTLSSAFETVQATTNSAGVLEAELLEDIAYTVTVQDDRYGVDPFPLVIKDKTEYWGGQAYAYDHRTCHGVGTLPAGTWPLELLDRSQLPIVPEKPLTSCSGDTVISGFNYGDIVAMEKKLDGVKVDGLADGDYDVIDIKAINPHRAEVTKIATGTFTIKEKTRKDRKVMNVYELKDGKPVKLEHKAQAKAGDPVEFTTQTLSMYPVVIEYGEVAAPEEPSDTVKPNEPNGKPSNDSAVTTAVNGKTKAKKTASVKTGDNNKALLYGGAAAAAAVLLFLLRRARRKK